MTHLPKPVVSICTVTNRPKCAEWLVWNVSRIKLDVPWEWVVIVGDAVTDQAVITSSAGGLRKITETMVFQANFNELLPLQLPGAGIAQAVSREEEWVQPTCLYRVQEQHKDKSCGLMRNAALKLAQGKYVAWLDDDDWHHPDKYQLLLDHMKERPEDDYVGWRTVHLMALQTRKVAELDCRVLINGGCAMYKTELAEPIRYDNRIKASDTPWVRRYVGAHKGTLWEGYWPHTLITRHTANTGNKLPIGRCTLSLSRFAKKVGPEIWADSAHRIEQLRTALL